MTAPRPLHVAFVAPEAAPLAKVGGLADVVGALPPALAPLGVRASIVVPDHPGARAALARAAGGALEEEREVRFVFDGRGEKAAVAHAAIGPVEVRLLAVDGVARARIYGYEDDVRRYVRFSLAAAALVDRIGADVVHAHDWPTALLPALGAHGRFDARSVFTIHNLAFQGRWNPHEMQRWTGLPGSVVLGPGMEFYGDASLMKGAIVFADAITAVSPTYAREILGAANGHGLDGVLRANEKKLLGIVNGIDTVAWDPAKDPALPAAFSAERPAGKDACERALCEELSLEPPVLGVVSRLAWQKGLDAVLAAVPGLVDRGVSLAIVASGEAALEAAFTAAAARHRGRVAVQLAYDERLARRVYAGSRGFLIPSRYEPCGLTQLIAMRYGSLPIARRVGGLADTIEDGVTGYLYDGGGPAPLLGAVDRFLRDPDRPARAARAMRRQSSWEPSARAYAELYRRIARR